MELISSSPEETLAFAAEWVRDRQGGEVIALHGDLGAGKTCFVQGLAEGLSIQENVTSPTYSLIQEYDSTPKLVHADLYRLQDELEAESAGLTDYFVDSVLLAMEWSERIPALLPADCWRVMLEHGETPEQRKISIRRGTA